MTEKKTPPDFPNRLTDYDAWSEAVWRRAYDRAQREKYAQRTPSGSNGRAA